MYTNLSDVVVFIQLLFLIQGPREKILIQFKIVIIYLMKCVNSLEII